MIDTQMKQERTPCTHIEYVHSYSHMDSSAADSRISSHSCNCTKPFTPLDFIAYAKQSLCSGTPSDIRVHVLTNRYLGLDATLLRYVLCSQYMSASLG